MPLRRHRRFFGKAEQIDLWWKNWSFSNLFRNFRSSKARKDLTKSNIVER